MLLFLIKKTFFDLWDNLLRIFLINLGFFILLLITFGIFYLSSLLKLYIYIPFVIAISLISIYIGGASLFVMQISDYKKPEFLDFFTYIRTSFKTSLFFALIIIVYSIIIYVAFNYYFSQKNIVALLAGSLLFWLTIIVILSIQFFFPIYSRFENNPIKVIRKCLLIFFDNLGFSLFIFAGIIFLLILSGFVAGFLPGLSTILLWLNGGFKLRLYKYDYQEEHPDANMKKIPWKSLIAHDVEMIGHRSLKGMIFPWKD